MPVLKDFRKLIELSLPKSKGKVWIYDYMLAQDSIDIEKIYLAETNISVNSADQKVNPISLRAIKYYEAQDVTMKSMIAKWDFTDEKGKVIEPTPDNIKKLPKQDYEYLKAEVDKRVEKFKLVADQKKN